MLSKCYGEGQVLKKIKTRISKIALHTNYTIHSPSLVIGNTGSIGHYVTEEVQKEGPINLKLIPYGKTTTATSNSTLNATTVFDTFYQEAQTSHIFKTPTSGYLIPTGQICDHGCKAQSNNKNDTTR